MSATDVDWGPASPLWMSCPDPHRLVWCHQTVETVGTRVVLGWVYVAFIGHVFSQRIVTWRAQTIKHADLVVIPLHMALWQRDREGHPQVLRRFRRASRRATPQSL